ncbi:MAG: DNA mismatch repair protein MutS [Myxococcota bacterium]
MTKPEEAKSPRPQLEGALDEAQEAFTASDRRADQIGNVRLGLALVAVVLLLTPLVTRSGTPWWWLLPVMAVFLGLARFQDAWIRRRRDAEASIAYLEGAKSRLDDSWRGLDETGEDVGKPWRGHDLHYADDLDLFGEASLYQLLSRAQTRAGRQLLAAWMAEPAPLSEARERQEAVRALAAHLDLRRRAFEAVAADESEPLDDGPLLSWAKGRELLPAKDVLRLAGLLFPTALIITAVLAFGFGGAREPFYLVALAQIGLLFYTRRFTGPRAAMLSGPERTLGRYARLIDVVESMSDEDAVGPLREVKEVLQRSGRPASSELRGLERLVDLLDSRLNMFVAATLWPALMCELNIVLRADEWRDRAGKHLPAWLEALGTFEALASLGALAHERPGYAFPELVDEPGVFEAEGLTHPLLHPSRAVGNDRVLGGSGTVLLLSGSNMSGKSTWLRSVGLAVVLARMGAPVAARRLRLADVRLATSVRVVDSLAAGASHFYAELRRLKHVVDMARTPGPPVLYLLDEVLHGTNSRERFLGAVSVLKWLAEHGAFGIVTTHDLSLGRVADHLPSGAVENAHFSDDIRGDGLSFDYRMRPGPIETTNALRMMRAVGIDVEILDL